MELVHAYQLETEKSVVRRQTGINIEYEIKRILAFILNRKFLQ